MKRYLPLGLGVLGSVLAWASTRAPSGLAPTLVALPLALALLVFVGREVGARKPSSLETLFWFGWVAFAMNERRLGLPGARQLLVAMLALLFAWRVSRLLPALLRKVADRKSRWPTWPFAVLPLAVGLGLLPWIHGANEPNGDEPYFLLLSESLVSDFDFDLADEYRDDVAQRFTARPIEPQPGDWQGRGGEKRSRHESLLVVYLAPFWLAGGALGARFGMLVIWAFLAERTLALMRAAAVPARGALLAWVVATFAAPVAVYAAQIWIETAAGLALAIVLERWLHARQRATEDAKRSVAYLAALVALPLLKLRLLMIAVPLALVRLLERRRRRAEWFVLAALLAVVALVLWRNDRLVGRVLGIYLPTDFLPTKGAAKTYLLGFDGLLFDLAFGLFAAGPIWLAALSGLRPLLARRSIVGIALLACLPYLVAVASLRSWYGGWSPPFRYGVVLVPIAAVALGFALGRTPTRAERLLFGVLGFATALLTLAFIVEPGLATSFANGRSRIVDLAASPFAVDFVRFLPSALRPRTATWAVPLAALCVLWLARHDRRRRLPATALAATSAILSLFVALVIAAHRLPTRVAEMEDPWAARGVGHPYPELWAVDRTQDAGGLAFEAKESSRGVVPIPGSDRVAIRIVYRPHPANHWPLLLFVDGSSDVALARKWVEQGTGWQTLSLPEMAWTPGDRIWLAAYSAIDDPKPVGHALVIDRVEFDWR